MPFEYLKKPVYTAAPQAPAPVYYAPKLVPGEYITSTQYMKTPQGDVLMKTVQNPVPGQRPITMEQQAMDAYLQARAAIKQKYGKDIAEQTNESYRTKEDVANLMRRWEAGDPAIKHKPARWETGQHPMGMAIDINKAISMNPGIINAMAEYGFRKTVPDDYPHFQYIPPELPGGSSAVVARQRR